MVFNSIYSYLHYNRDCMEEYLYLYIPYSDRKNGMWFVVTTAAGLQSVDYALEEENING